MLHRSENCVTRDELVDVWNLGTSSARDLETCQKQCFSNNQITIFQNTHGGGAAQLLSHFTERPRDHPRGVNIILIRKVCHFFQKSHIISRKCKSIPSVSAQEESYTYIYSMYKQGGLRLCGGSVAKKQGESVTHHINFQNQGGWAAVHWYVLFNAQLSLST